MKKSLAQTKPIVRCPYCHGTKIIKKGFRKKKYEKVQLYYCQHCKKKFTPLVTKGKTYPLRVILEALTSYNRFLTLEESAQRVSEKYGFSISLQTVSNWVQDFRQYLPFLRMRDFIAKKYSRDTRHATRDTKIIANKAVVESKMFHNQIYDFKYHRAKTELILEEEFRHYKLRPLQEFLELVTAECPHTIFRETKTRASEFKEVFNLKKVKITPKANFACKIARLVLQAVANNRLRHQILEEFMFFNDSVTVAVEVPVLLDEEDILHYRDELGFEVPDALRASNSKFQIPNSKQIQNPNNQNSKRLEHSTISSAREKLRAKRHLENSNLFRASDLGFRASVITGHIDLLQIRNGAIHILDFKPSARKAKPVDQLTIYALALSRLTGIRLFHFKCAWFDDQHYYEFFPLHVVHKKKKKKRRRKQKK